MVFTIFIVTDMIQVRTITVLVIPSKLEVYFFIARQADWRAIIGTELIQQRDDHRDLFTLDDCITINIPLSGVVGRRR